MVGRIVAWLPWLLAEASLGWVEAQLWPVGGLWLIVLWTAALLVFRGVVSSTSTRLVRLLLDLMFAGFCVLAAFEGGWYVLPAVAAFALCDLAGLAIQLPSLPDDTRGYEVRLAVASTFAGFAGLAVSISGPIYATATGTIEPDGSVVTTHSPAPLVQTGIAPPIVVALVIVAALLVLVTLTAAIHLRTGDRAAWLALLAVTGSLVVAVILTAATLGLSLLWLVPAIALAVSATSLDRNGVPSRRGRGAS